MNCINTKWVFPDSNPQGIEVPCGKCLACLSNKRNDWSFRLEQEWKRSKSAAFITLTYHPKYVPDTGVSKKHLQLFMKRLRKKNQMQLRYYAVGEYGTKTNRPHYHIILFNYEHKERVLQSAWKFGIVHIGQCNQASIRYCTKYIIQSGNHISGQTKPFALMSRGYGLGAHYLTDEMVEYHRKGERNYTMVEGVKGRLPRYYKDKIWPSAFYITNFKAIRTKISQQAKQDVQKTLEANLALLKRLGSLDPMKTLTEMRSAVMSRIKQKTSFTQTL